MVILHRIFRPGQYMYTYGYGLLSNLNIFFLYELHVANIIVILLVQPPNRLHYKCTKIYKMYLFFNL